MKISFIQQTNEKGEALNNVLLCTPEPSSQWIFSLHSHSLLKERLLLSFCLRFSSSRGKHVARAKGMSCARGRLLTRLSRALTPWLIPAIMSSRIKTRCARWTRHALIPTIKCRAKSSTKDASCARGRPFDSHFARASHAFLTYPRHYSLSAFSHFH